MAIIMTERPCIYVCILLVNTAVLAELMVAQPGNVKVNPKHAPAIMPGVGSTNSTKETSKSAMTSNTKDVHSVPMADEGVREYTDRRSDVMKGIGNRLSRVPGFQIFLDTRGLRRAHQPEKRVQVAKNTTPQQHKKNRIAPSPSRKSKSKKEKRRERNKKRRLKNKLRRQKLARKYSPVQRKSMFKLSKPLKLPSKEKFFKMVRKTHAANFINFPAIPSIPFVKTTKHHERTTTTQKSSPPTASLLPTQTSASSSSSSLSLTSFSSTITTFKQSTTTAQMLSPPPASLLPTQPSSSPSSSPSSPTPSSPKSSSPLQSKSAIHHKKGQPPTKPKASPTTSSSSAKDRILETSTPKLPPTTEFDFFDWVYFRLAPKYDESTETASSASSTSQLPRTSTTSSTLSSSSSSSQRQHFASSSLRLSQTSTPLPSLSSQSHNITFISMLLTPSSSSTATSTLTSSSLSSISPLPQHRSSSSSSSSSTTTSPSPISLSSTSPSPSSSSLSLSTASLTLPSQTTPLKSSPTIQSLPTSQFSTSAVSRITDLKSTSIGTRESSISTNPATTQSLKESEPKTLVQNLTLMFQTCVHKNQTSDEESIVMKQYITAYTKLTKTFEQFGIVLKLANEDILKKLGYLNRLHQKDSIHYQTFESMFEYEFSTDMALNRNSESGVRENRIIHRGLELFYEILRELSCMGDNCDNSMSSRVRHHYDVILSPYHTFWIRNAARLALLTFPSRSSMMATLGENNDPHGIQQVTLLTQAVGKVYNKIELLYNDYPAIE